MTPIPKVQTHTGERSFRFLHFDHSTIFIHSPWIYHPLPVTFMMMVSNGLYCYPLPTLPQSCIINDNPLFLATGTPPASMQCHGLRAFRSLNGVFPSREVLASCSGVFPSLGVFGVFRSRTPRCFWCPAGVFQALNVFCGAAAVYCSLKGVYCSQRSGFV